MLKRICAGALLASMLLGLTACGGGTATTNPSAPAGGEASPPPSGETVVLRLSQSTPSDNPVSEALTYFSEQVDELTGGSVKVEVHFDAALGSEPASIEGLTLGTLEMARVATANMASFVPELEVFNLPFLFRDSDHYWAVLNGEVGDFFKEKFEENGFKLLTFYEDGTRNIYHTDKFIETVEDLQGVKIRTMTSPMIQKAFTTMGAAPTPMDFGELYTALQQGVVDAGENNYSTIYTSKQYEVAPYITTTEHYRIPSVLIMSMSSWESLTPEQQEQVQQAADLSCEWEIPHFIEADQEYLQAALEDGAKEQAMPQEERDRLVEMLQPIYEECNEQVGNDLVTKILETK